jgi:hypothetical protein
MDIIVWIAQLVSSFGIVVGLGFTVWSLSRQRKETRRNVTSKIWEEWWGKYLETLRKHFYDVVDNRPEEIQKLRAMHIGLNQIEKYLPGDEGQLRKLTYFFDQIGWLGMSKLIDIDIIIGPMAHVIRRVWFVTEPFIKVQREEQREKSGGKWLDPVRHIGFEWLFKQTEKKPQIKLIKKMTKYHQALPGQDIISKDEAEFKKRIELVTASVRQRCE